MAPSRRMTSPLRIGFSMMCTASAPYSSGLPNRDGCGTCLPSDALALPVVQPIRPTNPLVGDYTQSLSIPSTSVTGAAAGRGVSGAVRENRGAGIGCRPPLVS